ncbi:MAG: hypothetical protein KF787_07485 [Phycisphaeraceae bacterium]|nr:hypothetical protein [Phycisphaeraceae bacterium]
MTKRRDTARWLWEASAAAWLGLGGCGATPGEYGRVWVDERVLLEPADQRTDAVTGHTLVIPVEVRGSLPKKAAGVYSPDVRLADGSPVKAALRWITVHPTDAMDRAGSWSWLPEAGRWKTYDHPPPADASGLVMAVLAVDLSDAPAGGDLLIGRRRVALNWVPSPAIIASDPSVRLGPALPPGVRDNPLLSVMTRDERHSPVRRWRYRLMSSGLHPLTPVSVPAGDAGVFADPVLEAMAAQKEARWSVAIGTIERRDPDLAADLSARLCAVVIFDGSRVVAPAWATDQSELDALLLDLLDPSLDHEARSERVRAWIGDSPPAHAWVIDDAAERDAESGANAALAGVVNFERRPHLGWTAWADASGREIEARPDPVTIAPMSASTVLAPVPADAVVTLRSADGSEVKAAALTVHLGPWESRVVVDATATPAEPPGVSIGPLVPDVTLEGFLGGRGTRAVERSWATRASLRRGAWEEAPPGHSPSVAPWELHIECSRPDSERVSSPGSVAGDQVRIHVGSRSAPALVLRVDESGAVVREDDRGLMGYSAMVRVTREPDRWTAIVRVPSDAVESRGILRIGLERTDSRGLRSAWPRAMLPWQAVPGRAVIDLAAWDR